MSITQDLRILCISNGLLEKLSVLNNKEIEVDGDTVRLTKDGIDNCKEYDPTFREDFY